jgi:hypothetical protein
LIGDTTGTYLLALDHDSPSNAACAEALGKSVTACGDITIFSINQTTGRLSLVLNAQVTASSGQPLTFFPVPANPIDFVMTPGYVLTLTGTPTTGDYVFPYGYSGTSGQLTVSQNSSQPLTNDGNPNGLVDNATAIINTSGVIYVLDNEPITIPSGGTFTADVYPSQILPFTLGSSGALQADTGGIIPDDSTLSNPIQMLVESKSKYLYVANQGNNVTGNNPESGIAGYYINTVPAYQLSFLPGEPFGSGSGPQCIVEDPSDQYIYEANLYDSSITGRALQVTSGELLDLQSTSTYTLPGPATWCLIDGRTG